MNRFGITLLILSSWLGLCAPATHAQGLRTPLPSPILPDAHTAAETARRPGANRFRTKVYKYSLMAGVQHTRWHWLVHEDYPGGMPNQAFRTEARLGAMLGFTLPYRRANVFVDVGLFHVRTRENWPGFAPGTSVPDLQYNLYVLQGPVHFGKFLYIARSSALKKLWGSGFATGWFVSGGPCLNVPVWLDNTAPHQPTRTHETQALAPATGGQPTTQITRLAKLYNPVWVSGQVRFGFMVSRCMSWDSYSLEVVADWGLTPALSGVLPARMAPGVFNRRAPVYVGAQFGLHFGGVLRTGFIEDRPTRY